MDETSGSGERRMIDRTVPSPMPTAIDTIVSSMVTHSPSSVDLAVK